MPQPCPGNLPMWLDGAQQLLVNGVPKIKKARLVGLELWNPCLSSIFGTVIPRGFRTMPLASRRSSYRSFAVASIRS